MVSPAFTAASMLTAHHFSDLLRELRQLERSSARVDSDVDGRGRAILDAFLRHSAYDHGAVYLRAEGGRFLLAAKSDSVQAPKALDCELPEEVLDRQLHASRFSSFAVTEAIEPRVQTLVPFRHAREVVGLLALSRDIAAPSASEDLEFLGAASSYLAALINTQRMADEVRQGDFQLKYRLWELESLYDIGLSIASTLNLDELAEEILTRTVSLLNARRAALFLREGDRFALLRAFGNVRQNWSDSELQQLASETAADEIRGNAIFPDASSFLVIPISVNDKVIGMLAAADREQRDGGVGPFEANDRRVLSLFANQVAIALENARLHAEALQKQEMERELQLAATIQRDILPRSLPVVPRFDIAAFSRPARQLGGDYHAFYHREDTLSIVVADVAGKSTPAALLVSALHAALQLLFDEGRDLGEIATELNRHIHRWSSENKFITLILATIDPDAETLRYVNAGHNPAYVIDATGVSHVPSHGLPIGILSGTRYSTQKRRFKPGSTLVLYSDGITEADNLADEEFGNERLENLLRERAGSSPVAITDAIHAGVDLFAGEAPQRDDQTIVTVRLTE